MRGEFRKPLGVRPQHYLLVQQFPALVGARSEVCGNVEDGLRAMQRGNDCPRVGSTTGDRHRDVRQQHILCIGGIVVFVRSTDASELWIMRHTARYARQRI